MMDALRRLYAAGEPLAAPVLLLLLLCALYLARCSANDVEPPAASRQVQEVVRHE